MRNCETKDRGGVSGSKSFGRGITTDIPSEWILLQHHSELEQAKSKKGKIALRETSELEAENLLLHLRV